VQDLRDHLLLHLDAGYNLARWLTRNDEDAQDIVQESFLRALKYRDSFKGEDSKPWFLKIICNTCYTWMKSSKTSQTLIPFEEELHTIDQNQTPETLVLKNADLNLVHAALELMSVEYREVLILRELECMPYQEISAVTDVPIGTVMSRLSRARAQLEERIKTMELVRGGSK
jgi:RNA polymerase sigma factor (sigma-70 family)